ncbi:MAG: hypothetical protein JWP92_2908 [Caulobacter sp.]|nr:hypothetical protein [Caulobacter sp.]
MAVDITPRSASSADAGEPAPGSADDPRAMTAAVAADLEAIFGRDAMPLAGVADDAAPVRALRRDGGRVRTSPGVLGAIVAAGLVGLSAGLIAAPSTDRAPEAPTLGEAARIEAPPAAARALTPPTPEPIVTAVAPPAAVVTAPPPHRAPSAAKPRRPVVAKARSTAEPVVRCSSRRCSHAEVLAADRRLRRAYARAIDAGVPRPVLVSYRDRWASLRRLAVNQPNRTVGAYGALARDLNRKAETARARGGGRRGSWS